MKGIYVEDLMLGLIVAGIVAFILWEIGLFAGAISAVI